MSPSDHSRKRLDVLCVEKGLFDTRSSAQASIMAGEITVDGKIESKAGRQLKYDAEIEHVKKGPKFVSRGGIKLEHAIDTFQVDMKDKVAIDIGSSTGGFTHCMLMRGIKKVYAVDVGKGIIDYKLRNDPRVILMEGVNARHLKPEDIPEKPDLATIDVSFISLRQILPAIKAIGPSEILALVKPQFEVGRAKVGKKGVVRNEEDIISAVDGIDEFAKSLGFTVAGRTESPITGPKGNREFFLYFKL